MQVATGNLYTPDGTPYVGFKVTIGGVTDPASIERTYEDIERILHSNQQPYKVFEEKTEYGTFKSYTVET